MVAQEPPSHLKNHFEAIALQRGSADGRIAKISNWRVGSNVKIYNPPQFASSGPMSEVGQTRSFGNIGSMSGLPESGHERAINGAAAPSGPQDRAARRRAGLVNALEAAL